MTLPDLWPIFASIFAPMLVVVAGMMRYLHLDTLKTRDQIDKSSKENRAQIDKNRDLIDKNRDLIERTSKENRELIEESRKENRELIEESRKENRELIERIHRDLATSLGDVRERLAHIEGHLRIPPPADDDTAAEAA